MKRSLIHLSIAGALLVLAIAGYVFWYLAVARLQNESHALDRSIMEKRQESARIIDARSSLATLSESESRVADYFVSPDDIVPFLESVGEIGEAQGAAVEVVGVDTDRTSPGSRLSIALRITGSFNAIMRTTGALEHGAFDGAITNLSIDQSTIEGEGWNATATLSVGTKTL